MLTDLTPRRRRRGFTLVELAAVVVIIGILALFAVPRFLAVQESSRGAGVESAMIGIGRSVSVLASQNGTAANRLTYIESSYEDLSPDVVTSASVISEDQSQWSDHNGTDFDDANNGYANQPVEVMRFEQRFGDSFISGCLFFPPNTDGSPFAALNGTQIWDGSALQNDAPSWLTPAPTSEYHQAVPVTDTPRYVDVTSATPSAAGEGPCLSETQGESSATASQF